VAITRGIREFLSRDWDAAREAKDVYWGERVARLGPLEGWRMADELRRQALLQDHGWPHPIDPAFESILDRGSGGSGAS
jgi:hypothetical protein